ncbi:hypothetical protein RhiJN_10741 [Ceratobasidium sp. AG-Ba]|nr:hypothetical protein RhiJN_10741 [Ceratobasidium sp. AG-Ba]
MLLPHHVCLYKHLRTPPPKHRLIDINPNNNSTSLYPYCIRCVGYTYQCIAHNNPTVELIRDGLVMNHSPPSAHRPVKYWESPDKNNPGHQTLPSNTKGVPSFNELVMHPAYGQPYDQFADFFPNDFTRREASSSSGASASPLQGSESNNHTAVGYTIDPAQITGVGASSMPLPEKYAIAEGPGQIMIPHHGTSETNQTADTSAQLSGLNANTQLNSDGFIDFNWVSETLSCDDPPAIDLSQLAVIIVLGYGVLNTKGDVDKYIKWLKIKRKPRILAPEKSKPSLDCPAVDCGYVSRRPSTLREHLYSHLELNRKTSEL